MIFTETVLASDDPITNKHLATVGRKNSFTPFCCVPQAVLNNYCSLVRRTVLQGEAAVISECHYYSGLCVDDVTVHITVMRWSILFNSPVSGFNFVAVQCTLTGYSRLHSSLLCSRDSQWENQSLAVLCGWWLCILREKLMKETRKMRKRQGCLLANPPQEEWNLPLPPCSHLLCSSVFVEKWHWYSKLCVRLSLNLYLSFLPQGRIHSPRCDSKSEKVNWTLALTLCIPYRSDTLQVFI